jgi:hypothetical protein
VLKLEYSSVRRMARWEWRILWQANCAVERRTLNGKAVTLYLLVMTTWRGRPELAVTMTSRPRWVSLT